MAVIHDENMTVYARYSDMKIAERMLVNAIDKGHRLQGRKYQAEVLDGLMISTPESFVEQDTIVEVKSLMNGKLVQLRKSEVGGPTDPSTERYWCM